MAAASAPKSTASAPESNADLIRRGYAAFNAADGATLTATFDENATWNTPGRGSISGERHGRDAVFAQFGRYGEETQGTFRAQLINVSEAADGQVITLHRNTATRIGKSLDVLCCIVFDLRSGRVVSGREHFFDLYAWDEFWA